MKKQHNSCSHPGNGHTLWSPPLIHILFPVMLYTPLAGSMGAADVVMSASEEPAPGSLRHIVPVQSGRVSAWRGNSDE